MNQPKFEMGRLAVEHLIAKIQNNQLPISKRSFLPELIVRKSSGNPIKILL
jgi:DNA-binding LacI/PurR family transcriptional regulator